MRIAHLYPDLLNLYGDRGNIMCLTYRLEKRGIDAIVEEFPAGRRFYADGYDLIFIGGGQDFEQNILLDDLCKGKDNEIKKAILGGKVVLAICGGYQMLGKYYQTYEGERLEYIGALDFYTIGESKRLIGNYAFDTPCGTIIGFENHSGRTYLGDCPALGKVVSGFGNNGKDKTEGAHFKNTFCTYSHGPVLPKNPAFADHLIETALKNKYGEYTLKPLDDTAENFAREQVGSLYFNKAKLK